MTSEKRELEAALYVELLDELRAYSASQTKALDVLRSNIVNSVLASGLYLLDGDGTASESYQAPFGSLAIANFGPTDLTVTNSPKASSAPTRGKGTSRIPAGTFRVVNMAATEWTVYGSPGAAVAVEAFTKPQPPTAGGAAGLLAMVAGTADAVAGASLVEIAQGLFNGATWDRFRALSGAGDGLGVALASQPSSTAPASASGTNAAASIAFGAVAGQRNRVTYVAWSYSAAAAAGRLTVADGATNIVDQDLITAAAASGQLTLPPGGIKGSVNTALTVTLAAGGVGNVGKISAAALVA